MSQREILAALAEVEDMASVKCTTCTDVTEADGKPYCVSCRLYWEEVENGLFDFRPTPNTEAKT